MLSVVASMRSRRILSSFARYNLLYFTVLLFILFWMLDSTFVDGQNLLNILNQASVTGIFGIALSIIVIAGEFDLSLPAIGAFVPVVFSVFFLTKLGMPLGICYLLGLIVSIPIGLANGMIVCKIGIPSFIATLGMTSILQGVTSRITGGGAYSQYFWPKSYGFIGRGFILGIPNITVMFLVASIISVALFEYTKLGRYSYTVGSNPEVAHHVGILRDRVRIVAFALGAVVSVFAGTSVSSLLGYVDTSTTSGYLLPAATVTFLGSIFLKNGVVNIWGTVMATVFLAVFLNGSTLVGIPTALRDSGEGLILLLAIGVSRSLQTRAEKRAL